MNKIDRIREIIRKYQKESDKLYKEYKQKEKIAREKYSAEGFKHEFVLGVWTTTSGNARANADFAVRDVNEIFDDIEEEFNTWVMRPISPELTQVLNCINSFNLRLTLPELRVLETNVGCYFGRRIFAGLAEASGYKVNIPTMGDYAESLKAARNNAETAIRAYAGSWPDYPGKDLLEEWKYKGVSYGNYQHYHLYFAENFLKDGGELDRLEKLWNSAGAPLHYKLTQKEAENITTKVDKVFDSFGELGKEEAEKLLKEIPDIVSRIDSLPNANENAKKLQDYYLLNFSVAENKKEDEPEGSLKASSAIDLARQYSSSRGLVDKDAVAQYQ